MNNNKIEDKYNEIKKIIDRLGTEISIEESIDLYIDGKKLIKECEEELSNIEKRLMDIRDKENE